MAAGDWQIVKRELPSRINTIEAWIGALGSDRAVDQIIVIAWQLREMITRWQSYNDAGFRAAATADNVDVPTVFPAINTRVTNITDGVISYLTGNGQLTTRNGRAYMADKYMDADGMVHLDMVTPAESAPLATALNNLKTDLESVVVSIG